MKKTIALVLALILCATMLAACGGGGPSGKYKLSSMTEGGVTFNASQMAELGLDADSMYIEFQSGSNFKLAMLGETQSGTFAVDGKTIKLTADGETINATLDGNKITIEESGTKMVFAK